MVPALSSAAPPELGLELMPDMPIAEAIETARAAEQLGYAYCLVTDEGLMHDPYVLLGAMAGQTRTIRLGAATSGYTRHPAVTAAAAASLQELSQGRAFVTLVAGGSMTLSPMGLDRTAPLTVVRETVEILRRLWTGEAVTWNGQRFSLDQARLAMGAQHIPICLIWAAPRGFQAEAAWRQARRSAGPAGRPTCSLLQGRVDSTVNPGFL